MAMSDCEKCWDTPCSCGWQYRTWTIQRLKEEQRLIQYYIDISKEVSNEIQR